MASKRLTAARLFAHRRRYRRRSVRRRGRRVGEHRRARPQHFGGHVEGRARNAGLWRHYAAAHRGPARRAALQHQAADRPRRQGRIVLTNPSSSGMPHGIAIRGHGSGRVVGPGGTSTVTATLKRGTYTFLCPVPGHAQRGMTGTLTVR